MGALFARSPAFLRVLVSRAAGGERSGELLGVRQGLWRGRSRWREIPCAVEVGGARAKQARGRGRRAAAFFAPAWRRRRGRLDAGIAVFRFADAGVVDV